jgi:hypothetical protein
MLTIKFTGDLSLEKKVILKRLQAEGVRKRALMETDIESRNINLNGK